MGGRGRRMREAAIVLLGLGLGACAGGSKSDPAAGAPAEAHAQSAGQADTASVADLDERRRGCAEVQLVERSSGARAWSDSRLHTDPPERVAVLPFWPVQAEFLGEVDVARASYLLTAAFGNRFSQLPYTDIERTAVQATLNTALDAPIEAGGHIPDAQARKLGEALGADAVILGQVQRVDQLFMLAYAQIAAEVRIELLDVASGCRLWVGEHVARSHAGGFSLDPVGAAFQVVKSLGALGENNQLVVIDRLCRELVTEIPVPEDTAREFGPDLLRAAMAPTGPWLPTGETVTWEVHTDKPLVRGEIQVGDTVALPLEPVDRDASAPPYAYTAQHVFTPERSVPLSSVRITGADRSGYQLDALYPAGRVGVDGTRPPPVADLSARYAEGAVELAWKPATQRDVAGYRVERAATAGGPFETIAEPSGRRHSDPSPIDSVGFYRVRSVDKAGQLSPPGRPVKVHKVTPGPTSVPERLARDTTWLAGASPYVLTTRVTVPRGVTLHVQPGTTVLAEPGAALIVAGRLLANGAADAPIRFEPRRPDAEGLWAGVAIAPAAGAPSSLRRVTVSGAEMGLKITAAEPQVTDNVFINNGIGVVVRDNAFPDLSGNTVRNNLIGVQVEAADPLLAGNTFRRNRQVDVALDASAALLRDNDFAQGAPTAIRVAGGMESAGVVQAIHNWWGSVQAAEIDPQIQGPVSFSPVLDAAAPEGRPVQAKRGATAAVAQAPTDAPRARSSDPEGAYDRLERGIAAWETGENARALDLLGPLQTQASGNPTLQYALALLHFEAGQMARAERAARAAAKANPASVNFQRTHGIVLLEIGRRQAARAALARALKLDASDITSRTLLQRLEEQDV